MTVLVDWIPAEAHCQVCGTRECKHADSLAAVWSCTTCKSEGEGEPEEVCPDCGFGPVVRGSIPDATPDYGDYDDR